MDFIHSLYHKSITSAYAIADHIFRTEFWLILFAWVMSLIGTVIYYKWQHDEPNKSVRGYFRYTFPKELWQHPSCRRDYVFAFVNRVIEPLTLGSAMVAIGGCSVAVYYTMVHVFGPIADKTFSWPVWIFMTFVALMLIDLFTWYGHYLEHKIPLLWEIHKVHHSIEFLNPVSNRRHHPLQPVWETGLFNSAAGIALGVASYVFHVPMLDNALMGIDVIFVGNALSFYQLRHSHVPLHYGKFEKYFLSPAQHRLHHSVEKQDWDVNFGLFTSFWDRVFKTIRYTKPEYKFRIGLEPQYQKQYQSVWGLYITPLINIGKMVYSKINKIKIGNTINNRINVTRSETLP